MARTKPIPKTIYIASYKPNECIGLLHKYGITHINTEDTQSIARGLTLLIERQNQEFLNELVDLHPDFEMIRARLSNIGFVNADGDINTETVKTDTTQNITNYVNDHLISKETAHILIGVGVSLGLVGTMIVLIKNIKQ